MPDYFLMDKPALLAERERLAGEYQRYQNRGLKLDMSRGKPAPEQLDLSMPLLRMDDCIDDSGVDARNYGNLEGIPEARRFFAEMLGVSPAETIVCGNSSLHMMYTMFDIGWRKGFGEGAWKDCPNPKFLCPAPGYDRHFRISEGYGFELLLVPMTPDGPDMDVVEELVQDEGVKGIWCIPVYSNPDGYVYSAETVRRMAELQPAAKDFKIMWDNAYGVHHFTGVASSCPNILTACKEAGCEDRPLLFCSTSKITFAGSGVGAMGASVGNVQLALDELFPMTIGFDKINQLRHARFLRNREGVAAHMKKHAAFIRPKFEMVLDILRENLSDCGPVARWTEPCGGYFFSFFVMDGCAARVVALCKEAGVVLTGAGAAFPYGRDPWDSHIRIAPTFPPLDELRIAAELLCVAARMACVDKLLSQKAEA